MKKLMGLIALGYPVGLAGLIWFMMRQNPRSIFDQYYLLGTLVFLPATLLTFVVIIARSNNAPKISAAATLGLWVLIVTGAHLWFISLMARTL